MAAAEYDIFLSHAWKDGNHPLQIKAALEAAGLNVWIDAAEIDDFASITRAVTEELANSKALLAYYSATYPLRRACQWELTAAFLAAQTEGDPRRRVLVINPESGADHIHPIELRDAKFRTAPNTHGEMQQLVQAIVKHVSELTGPLADIHPLTAPNWYGMMPVGSTRFVGRLKEMWEVHSLLHAGDVAQITGAAAATGGIGQVQGLGGVGKSLLAEEYALHFGAAYPGGVFWLRAYGNDDAKAVLGAVEREALRADQVRQMAERLGIDTHGLTAAQIEGSLSRKIAGENKPCLWVVDDVPHGLDGEALRRWFAPHAAARTLLTTRSREYGALAKEINLSVLTPDEAYQLLTSRRKPAGNDEEAQARLLAADLGYHALAVDVTGAALVSYGDAQFGKFREELADEDEDVLELAKDLADALPNGHEKSIAKTLLRSILRLGPEGRDFLRLASVLAVAPIPALLVKVVFEMVDKISTWDAQWRTRQALRQVTVASLAEITGEADAARSVHTLVSRTMRFHEKSSPERTTALRSKAILALRAEIAKTVEDTTLHPQIDSPVQHARYVVSIPVTIPEANLIGWVARYDFLRGAYSSAVTLCSKEYEFCVREHGSEHPLTLVSMNNLGLALAAHGNLNEARKVTEETLAIRRKVLGTEHPDTLTSVGNLGNLLWELGELVGARHLQEETLARVLRLRGGEDKDTLTLMHNLAVTLRAQGELAPSRALLERALDGRRRVLGAEHMDTLATMHSLSNVLVAQGDFGESRKLEEEAFTIRRRVLGPNHPHTLTSMAGLAIILRRQGDLPGSLKLEEEVLAIRHRLLGSEHPDTLIAMGNLATTLHFGGNYARARELQDTLLSTHRRVLGPEHRHTLTSMSNLALTLQAQGELARARTLNTETLAIRQRVLGLAHPDTLQSMNNLANTQRAQGDLACARKMHEEVLAMRRRDLGQEHPDTTNSAWNLFRTLYDLNERVTALAILHRDLCWLLDRDPATLGADQRQIREMVSQVVKETGDG